MNTIFQTYKYIWLCGLAASGKTSALKYLSTKLSNDVHFLNDSEEIVYFVSQDKEQLHHKKPTEQTFVVTDSEAFMYSLHSLSKKVRQYDQSIIEISRGKDTLGIVNLTYEAFISVLPEDIKKQSLLIYVEAAKQIRFERNAQRPKLESTTKSIEAFTSFYCPDEAIQRFFSEDDFFDHVNTLGMDTIIIHNNSTQRAFEEKLNYYFSL